MLKKILKLNLFALALAGSSVFANTLNFDAGHLTGNFTRENFENFKFFSINISQKCSVPLTIVTEKFMGSDDVEFIEQDSMPYASTQELLEVLDENEDQFGRFLEFRNNDSRPIPNCAKNAKFSFKN